MSGEACGCFPGAGELAVLADAARRGHRHIPFVGDGSLDTELGCEHGTVRLGDVLDAAARACSATTKAGEPCKGTAGADGLCAAHKETQAEA